MSITQGDIDAAVAGGLTAALTISTGVPTGGADGDFWLPGPPGAAGIYQRASGSWSVVAPFGEDLTGPEIVQLLSALTGNARLPASAVRDLPSGEDATARAGVAANARRLDAVPVYAARLAVWPPNVRQHSDFQRQFQSTLAGLVASLATDGGSTGTRFANVFRILARDADGDVVQLHTQGWSFTNDERQTIEWEVSAAEFNQLGTEVATNGLEVWGEFRAVYGGGVDELRGRTNPVFIDFGEQDEWPATRGELPEQRVLRDVSVPSEATRGKVVINDDKGYLTRAERDVTTPASATFEDFAASDYVGAFDDDNAPDASANIGRWYWNTTRLTAFRAFRDDTLGAIWTAADVDRLVTGGDYRGAWGTDKEATAHIQQVGDFYYLYFNALRRATGYTPPVHTHLRDEFRRLTTSDETDRRLEFIVQGSPSQIDKNNIPSAFNFLLTHKTNAFPEAATARIDFFGRQILYPNYQPSIESRSLGWGVDDADRRRIATLTEGRSEDAVVRLLDSDDVEVPGSVSPVDFTVVEGGSASEAEIDAAVDAYLMENPPPGGVDTVARAAAASAASAASAAQTTADGKAAVGDRALQVGSAGDGGDSAAAAREDHVHALELQDDLSFNPQQELGLSTARKSQIGRVPADGGNANQVWAKGPANEKPAWRDQIGAVPEFEYVTVEPNAIARSTAGLQTPLSIVLHGVEADARAGATKVRVLIQGQQIAEVAWRASVIGDRIIPAVASAGVAEGIFQNLAGTADHVTVNVEFRTAANVLVGDNLPFNLRFGTPQPTGLDEAEVDARVRAVAPTVRSLVVIISTIASYDAAQNRFEDSGNNEVVVPDGAIVTLTQAVYDAAVADSGFTPNANAIYLTR